MLTLINIGVALMGNRYVVGAQQRDTYTAGNRYITDVREDTPMLPAIAIQLMFDRTLCISITVEGSL